MAKRCFVVKRFQASALRMIDIVNMILDEYAAQNFRLSLRQLYYQLVARDYIPNNVRSYKNLGVLVSNARQAGLVDWDMIEDRGRNTVSNTHWSNPGEIVNAAAQQFRIDKWKDQPWHIEVMVEKDALSGVLEPVCRQLDVAITANKGYSSSSTMYEIGRRIYEIQRSGDFAKQVCVIYLGDHDPSGIDMTRDVRERLILYGDVEPDDVNLGNFEVVRLALNYDQVQLWNPPENPAKETDARFKSYRAEFGKFCWELDAVEPVQLARLVQEEVLSRRDMKLWDAAVKAENRMRSELLKFANSY